MAALPQLRQHQLPSPPVLQSVDELTLAVNQNFTLRSELPLTFAVDGVHHLAVVAYDRPLGVNVPGLGWVLTDSNSMSQIDLVDLTTGQERDAGLTRVGCLPINADESLLTHPTRVTGENRSRIVVVVGRNNGNPTAFILAGPTRPANMNAAVKIERCLFFPC